MTSIERTAYPRFGRQVSARELTGLSPSLFGTRRSVRFDLPAQVMTGKRLLSERPELRLDLWVDCLAAHGGGRFLTAHLARQHLLEQIL
jgi:hypothetical protein